MQNQKGNIVLMIVGIVAILAIGGGVGSAIFKNSLIIIGEFLYCPIIMIKLNHIKLTINKLFL